MNEKCEMVFILDRSGSMHGLESDTIGGFNSMIEQQKKEGIQGVVSTALFDDGLEIPFDRIDLNDVPKMTNEIYYTRGCTALFDAVGTMIRRVQKHRRYLSESAIPGKTIFVITTDGLENASCEFSGPEVKKMIEQRKEEGWEFLYLGANVDAVTEAERIGIHADRAVRYHADDEGTRLNYRTVGKAVACFSQAKPIPDSWSDDIKADYAARKPKR